MNRFAIILLLVNLAACADHGTRIAEELDPLTGVTITRSQVPLVFYRDNSGVAAHAKSLVHLGPLEVNRMGEYRYYLWLGIWNTLQDAAPGVSRDGFESIVIYADEEPLPLDIMGWSAEAIGASRPAYVQPVSSSTDAYYEVTVDHLRLIAAATRVRIHTTGNKAHSYELWNDQKSAKASFQEFLKNSVY
jgi:hypothetical protein